MSLNLDVKRMSKVEEFIEVVLVKLSPKKGIAVHCDVRAITQRV